jgi:hypothetical protein
LGVNGETVWRWRKTFGVGKWGTPGSKSLHAELSGKGAEAVKAKERTAAELKAKSERSKRLGLKPPGRPRWTPEEDVILGKMPDKEAAYKLGTTPSAARSRRLRLKVEPYAGPG